jgi:hypothetical protein
VPSVRRRERLGQFTELGGAVRHLLRKTTFSSDMKKPAGRDRMAFKRGSSMRILALVASPVLALTLAGCFEGQKG